MQAIIFDLDDTLYDLSQHRATHLRRAWAPWLSTLDGDTADAVIRAAMRERIFFPDMVDFLLRHGVRGEAEREQLLCASRETWFADLCLDPGVPALLDQLAGRYRLGLITNGPADIQGKKIAHFGLSRWFTAMTISGVFGVEKPHSRIFFDMCERLETSPAGAVMVGDNPQADIAGAQGVRMRAVWIRHPHVAYPSDLPAPWRSIGHVTELPLILED